MPKDPVLHWAAEVLGCLHWCSEEGHSNSESACSATGELSLLYISFGQKMTAEISAVLWQIQSPAGKLWVQAEKVTSDQITANCSGSATQSWTAAGLMNKTRGCTWRYFCLCFLCPGQGDLAWLSGHHHPADWPQKHLGGPWKLGFRLSWSLIIPWPCQVEILEEKEPTGESGSSGTLSFLYVSRGCCSGEKRLEQNSFCLQLLREGKKKKKHQSDHFSRTHFAQREEDVWIMSSSEMICLRAEAGMQSWKLCHLLKTSYQNLSLLLKILIIFIQIPFFLLKLPAHIITSNSNSANYHLQQKYHGTDHRDCLTVPLCGKRDKRDHDQGC